MSNNEPDYENNLIFEPKSADDLNKQERQSEVLIKAIEKCEKLEKEIIALKKEYQAECNRADELEDSLQTSWKNESKLKEQLEIAIKGLRLYSNLRGDGTVSNYESVAKSALKEIKELDK